MHASPATAAPTPAWRRSPGVLLAITLGFLTFLLLPRVRENARLFQTFVGVGAASLVWFGALWLRSVRGGPRFRIELAPILKSHYIQGSVQLCIYAYWGWYWRDVYAEAPLILAQFVFLYVFGGLLAWTRGKPWSLGLGPLPIILSTNVFIWFLDDWYVWQFALVAAAALGKEFIRWSRDGKKVHIFNPSAFALAVFSIVLIATDATKYTLGQEIATTFYRPPHIYLEIFLLGLIVQYFFGVTLMTLATAAVLVALNVIYTQVTGIYFFIDTNIAVAVFLGFHLLVTDPKTSPRSNVGKVLFGALYGLSIWALYWLLGRLDAPQFYDKLLPIPVLNLCVRWIDRVAESGFLGRLGRWEAAFPRQRLNLIHMGCWAALFGTLLGTGFVEAPHEGRSLAWWKDRYNEGCPGSGERLLKLIHTRVAKDSGVAANALGSLYDKGEIVPQSDAAADYWFARACELGSERGCLNVARNFLYRGRVESEAAAKQALAVLEGESEQTLDGDVCALVGLAYELGRCRPKDLSRALALYGRGIQLESLDSAKGLARIRISQGQATDDLRSLAPVFEQSAAAGDSLACLYLAQMTHAGLGVPRDEARAQELLARACALGSVAACEAIESAAQ